MLSRVGALAFAIILLRFAPPAAAPDARAGRLELDPSKTLIEFELPARATRRMGISN